VLDPSSLRGRLTLAYAVALVASLALFATVAVAVVDAAQRRALDTQLATIGNALRLVGDTRDNRLTVDASDRAQFNLITSAKADAAIVDAGGRVAVTSDSADAAGLGALAAAGRNGSLSDAAAKSGNVRLLVEPIFFPNNTLAGHILVWRDRDAIAALDRSIALAFALLIPLLAGVAMLAGGAIARRGLEPVGEISRVASEIEAHDLARRIELPQRDDELGRLMRTFNRMLDRLQRAFERERRFTSDASHELRAPLSVIWAEADLALRKERSPEEYRRALEAIAAEAQALEQLTRDLLAAARSDERNEPCEAVAIGEVATAVRGRMEVLAATRGLRLEQRGDGGDVLVNRAMLERALLGVVHNAMKFTPEGGAIALEIAHENGLATLTVTDQGPGFSAEALSHGFDRFWRDDESRSSEGNGLGLTLVKTIIERYGGTVALSNAAPRGATVRMSFPELTTRGRER
jgi:heavy metal sensor kinase